jgi:hypothetical protein
LRAAASCRIREISLPIGSAVASISCPTSNAAIVGLRFLPFVKCDYWPRLLFAVHTIPRGNGHRGTQTVPVGAAEAIRLTLLADGGPTGTYSDSKGNMPW